MLARQSGACEASGQVLRRLIHFRDHFSPRVSPPAARNDGPRRQHFGRRKQAEISLAALCGRRGNLRRADIGEEVTKVQSDTGFGIDIAVGPCSVWVPAQAVADARAGWSALRAEAGGVAAQRIYEAMAATPPAA
jgi:hypothetical protein